MTAPPLRERRVMHLRTSNGGTYGSHLIGPDGDVVGAVSSFVSRRPDRTPSRTVYTLFEPDFETESRADLLAEWRRRCEAKA